MKLDFSEVKQNVVVEEGTQHFSIIGAKEAKSANGTAMLVVDMKTAEDGFVRDNICLEGAGAFRMQQFLKAIGVSEEDASGMEAADFIGMEIDADIVHEEYNGEIRAKVKKYIA